MGFFNFFSRLFGSKDPRKILTIGLDNAGKSSIIHRMKASKTDVSEIVPTPGYNVEHFTRSNVTFKVFDMSGQGRFRTLWRTYFTDAEAIIFVIDSSDQLRLCVARDELLALVDEMADRCPLLIFSNKMDLPGSVSAPDLSEQLGLPTLLREWDWQVFQSNALTGEGLEEGIDWLISRFK
eukprot:gnl/Dysnectes_brevis/4564_a6189_837.p1 GENE.gnl/Dysnectes_brevis/4564_a6189_837~~gnl/Dysnectes_brevis/4564_a6189_837.p1  ORF type:complete len:180 (-),score=13.62 gnl/Dysnectes_brevis/4564_a6189_837:140-679(-)